MYIVSDRKNFYPISSSQVIFNSFTNGETDMYKLVVGMFLKLLIVIVLLFQAGCVSQEIKSPAGMETTVIMLRHAEKTQISKMLTDRGHKRARALINAVGERKVDAIYSPDFQRNIDTVRPLAEHHGLEIIRVKRSEIWDLPEQFIEQHPGETVVWVGNTFNLEKLYEKLGGEGEAPDNYGDLFFLTIPDKGETRVIRSRYGD
jgi:hypothetical protein